MRLSLFFTIILSSVLTGQLAQAQDSRLQQIQQRQRLDACIWPDYYSISYRDPRTRQLTGIDVDLARELAADMQVEVRFIDSSFASLIPDLLEQRCDVAMFGIGIIPEREAHLAFTVPHLQSDVIAITTKSNRRIRDWSDLDKAGNVIAVAKGTLHEPLMRERLQFAELITPETPKAREKEVLSGRADAFISDFPYSLRMMETTNWARMVKPSSTYHLTYYGWAIKPGDEAWLEYLNHFMQRIKQDGRLLNAARTHKLEPAVVLE